MNIIAIGICKRMSRWRIVRTIPASANGTNAPVDGRWGDYYTTRPDGNNWIAAGFIQEGDERLLAGAGARRRGEIERAVEGPR